MDEKNYLNVDVVPYCDRLLLNIEIKVDVDATFIECYKKALSTKAYVSLRSNGGPVVDDVQFYGTHARTQTFPHNKFALDEAEEFLKEFNDFLGIAYEYYRSAKARKAAEQLEKEKRAEEAAKEIEELKKRFNK